VRGRNRFKAGFAGRGNTGPEEFGFQVHNQFCATLLAASLSCISLFLFPFCGPGPHFLNSTGVGLEERFEMCSHPTDGRTGAVTHIPTLRFIGDLRLRGARSNGFLLKSKPIRLDNCSCPTFACGTALNGAGKRRWVWGSVGTAFICIASVEQCESAPFRRQAKHGTVVKI
jgi:hypothetical protein